MTMRPPEPTSIRIHSDGIIEGRNGHYEKYLKDLDGIYSDQAAFAKEIAARGGDTLMYRVEENRVGSGPGALIFGTSILLPGVIGQEYAMTRGHIHGHACCAEIYHCLAGHGVMLLDTVDGESRVLEISPGVVVHVPGYWVHRSINIGDEPLVTVFTYDEQAGQDYGVIKQAGGMSQLIVVDAGKGWRAIPNPRHHGYAPIAA